MTKFTQFLAFLALGVVVSAIPAREYHYEPEEAYEFYSPEEVDYQLQRVRRSTQENPNQKGDENKDGKWVFRPDLGRGEDGNTRGRVEVEKKGDDHDFHAGWGKVVDGPNKGKDTWHVGGSFSWR